MNINLNSLYSEIIFEHDKRPLNAGLRDPYLVEVHHVNPSCGDEITLRLNLAGEGSQAMVSDISYDAHGCAMSRASASIMSDLLIGKTVAQAKEIKDYFEDLMHQKGQAQADENIIEDGIALMGAAKFPARTKCVLMAWKAYEAALVESKN